MEIYPILNDILRANTRIIAMQWHPIGHKPANPIRQSRKPFEG